MLIIYANLSGVICYSATANWYTHIDLYCLFNILPFTMYTACFRNSLYVNSYYFLASLIYYLRLQKIETQLKLA